MTSSRLVIILFSICIVLISVIGYILYNRINDLRDYCMERLYNSEILLKEKFDDILSDLENKKNTLIPSKDFEEKQIINQLYSDLEKINEEDIEYDTSSGFNDAELEVSEEDLTPIKSLSPELIRENIPKHIKKDFEKYMEEIEITEDDLKLVKDTKMLDGFNIELEEDNKVEKENKDEESEEEQEDEEEESVEEPEEESEEEQGDEEEESVEEHDEEEEESEEEHQDEEEMVCQYVFKRGKNKGNTCDNIVEHGEYCKKHSK